MTDLLAPKEVAGIFHVSPSTARRWAARGVLGGFKVGGGFRFPRELVERAKEAKGANGLPPRIKRSTESL